MRTMQTDGDPGFYGSEGYLLWVGLDWSGERREGEMIDLFLVIGSVAGMVLVFAGTFMHDGRIIGIGGALLWGSVISLAWRDGS